MMWFEVSKQISIAFHQLKRESLLFVQNGDCENCKKKKKVGYRCQGPLLYVHNKQNTINTHIYLASASPKIKAVTTKIKT